MSKKTKKDPVHQTYNRKAFLAPESILSMAAIHIKVKPDGDAVIRISDCNRTIRIWNNLNTKEGKNEIIQKLDVLISELSDFRRDMHIRNGKPYPYKIKEFEAEKQ